MFSRKLRDLTDLASGKFQRDSCSEEIDDSRSEEIDESKKKNPIRRGPYIDWIRIILFAIPHLVDPLFFYVPVVNDDKKCLDLLWPIWEMAVALRSIHDIFHMIIILSLLSDYLCNTSGLRHEGVNSHRHNLIIDFLIAAPLPQILSHPVILKTRGPEFFNAMKLLKLIVVQYVARIIRIYSLFSRAIKNSSKLAEAIWPRVAFDLFLFLQAANVFGGLWYFMAIERETECWKKACINYTRRRHCSFNCPRRFANDALLNKFCPTKTRKTAIHDFGIFYHALESGIVEGTEFPRKFLHCFLWGLQNLSNLGQNLQASSDVRENIFVISVIISSLLLFGLLLGNMQKYLQSMTVRLKEKTLKAREIEEWLPFQKLSKNLQEEIRNYQLYIWRKTKDIDLENLHNNLPKELRRKLKRELCLKLLKKVEEFKKLKEETLDALCDRVKPAFYLERTHILREGDPIDDMIFVVQGKLKIYTLNSRITGSTGTDQSRDDALDISKEDLLLDGDFFGRELVAWAQDNRSSSDIPWSTRTIQAQKNVEAFTLMADDLKNVFIEHQICQPA